MRVIIVISTVAMLLSRQALAQDLNYLNWYKIEKGRKSRSISPENITGAVGAGAMAHPILDSGKVNVANAWYQSKELGQGWKVNPNIRVSPNEQFELANIKGSAVINHIWITPTGNWNKIKLKIFWDYDSLPAVSVPLGSFFCMAFNEFTAVQSAPILVNPGSGFNSYWQMPFRKHCRIVIENNNAELIKLYFQINYTLQKLKKHDAYFYAQYNESLPTKEGVHELLNTAGQGKYMGTYIAYETKNAGWWGEGELKFFIDDDERFPTIVTTGLEDYIGGSYDFKNKKTGLYQLYSTPYQGFFQALPLDSIYIAHQKLGMYRFHMLDPIYFNQKLRITVQDLGWKPKGGQYMIQKGYFKTVAYFYKRRSK